MGCLAFILLVLLIKSARPWPHLLDNAQRLRYLVNISLAADSLIILNTSTPLPGTGYRVASLSFADAAASVPEPSTLGMLCIGFLGFAAARKLKKH
jgi:hypothetical protein